MDKQKVFIIMMTEGGYTTVESEIHPAVLEDLANTGEICLYDSVSNLIEIGVQGFVGMP